MPLSGFGIKIMLASEWVKYFFCFYLLKKIVENWYNFFHKYLVEFSRKLLGLVLSVWKAIIDSVFLIDIDLFKLSVSSHLNFDSSGLSKDWSISSLWYAICAHSIYNISLLSFWMSMGSVVISPLSFLFLVIFVLFLFLLS